MRVYTVDHDPDTDEWTVTDDLDPELVPAPSIFYSEGVVWSVDVVAGSSEEALVKAKATAADFLKEISSSSVPQPPTV